MTWPYGRAILSPMSGRPPLHPRALSVVLDRDLARALDDAVARSGRSKSELLRDALRLHLTAATAEARGYEEGKLRAYAEVKARLRRALAEG